MEGLFVSSVAVATRPGWSLLFAKEPAPEAGGIGQMDMDSTVALGPPGKKGPPPSNNKQRIMLLVLLLVVVAGGGYFASNPDALMNLLGDVPGSPPPPLPPTPRVAKPAMPPPQPAAPTPAVPAVATAPAAPVSPPATPVVATSPPAPTPIPSPAPSAAPAPAAPAQVAPSAPVAFSTPLFGEGQRVTVVLDRAKPNKFTVLSADPAGTKPGPTVRPGSILIIRDADFQNNVWIYLVRTEKGTTGWISEKRLKAK